MNDLHSVFVSFSMIQAGLLGKDGWRPLFRLITLTSRFIITLLSLCIVSYFCFSIDDKAEEDKLDLVKDFTALLIIIDVDNIILGFADLKPEHIGFMALL